LGTELGKFKLEYKIKRAYFISNKTYCLILENGETIIKTKGVQSKSLSVKDFENMYFKEISVKATKTQATKNYSKGSVSIKDEDITLN
jgi:hypothetical protein